MADAALVRFVDDQRAQVRWLLSQLQAVDANATSELPTRALFVAVTRAVHNALTGYFIECTQKRYQPQAWASLLACASRFAAMQKIAPCEQYLIASWLEQELDPASALAAVQVTIAAVGVPELPQYRSSLLADTSLTVESQASPVIASSRNAPVLTVREFDHAWSELDALIQYERSQAVEC